MSTSTNVVKTCFACNKSKVLTEYYKHPQMGDGHLNKCKDCVKKAVADRLNYKMKDPEFREKEKARHRGKYHRLGYKDKHKPTPEQKKIIMDRYKAKYPEKVKAKNFTQHIKKSNPKHELHHWSYNEEHYKDVIELSVKNHNLIHRYLEYDQEFKVYRDFTGLLLDTKEKHLDFIEFILERHKEKKSA